MDEAIRRLNSAKNWLGGERNVREKEARKEIEQVLALLPDEQKNKLPQMTHEEWLVWSRQAQQTKPPCSKCGGSGEIRELRDSENAWYPCPACQSKPEQKPDELVADCESCEHRGDSSSEYCGACDGKTGNYKEAGWHIEKRLTARIEQLTQQVATQKEEIERVRGRIEGIKSEVDKTHKRVTERDKLKNHGINYH